MKNNKQLYESIMRSVSKTVKRILNESFIDDEEIEQADININLSRGADVIYESNKELFLSLAPNASEDKMYISKTQIILPYYYTFDITTSTLTIKKDIYVDTLFEILSSNICITTLELDIPNYSINWYAH